MMCGGRNRFKDIRKEGAAPILIEQFAEPCILLLLSQNPMHGYALMQELKETCLCDRIDAGNFYRVIARLKKERMIQVFTGIADQRRTTYTITPKGKKFLQGWVAALEKNNELLVRFLKKYKETAHE